MNLCYYNCSLKGKIYANTSLSLYTLHMFYIFLGGSLSSNCVHWSLKMYLKWTLDIAWYESLKSPVNSLNIASGVAFLQAEAIWWEGENPPRYPLRDAFERRCVPPRIPCPGKKRGLRALPGARWWRPPAGL